MEKNIKDYREKGLKSFILANVLLFLLGKGYIEYIVEFLREDSVWKAIGLLINSSVISTVMFIYSFIIDSLVPGKTKDTCRRWKGEREHDSGWLE